MKKSEVMNLIGNMVKFKRDNILFSDHRNTFYNWKKGEECTVIGYVELEQTPKLLVCSNGFDFEEIELRKVHKELEFDIPAETPTKLATAERRQLQSV